MSSDAILESLPDPLLVLEGWRIVRINEAARRMLSPEILERDLRELLVQGELERFELLDRQRSAGWSLPATCRMRFRKCDGAFVIGDARWARTPDGRVVLAIHDVTDATRAEDLMGRLARISGTMDGPDTLLDAAAPIFEALGWTVAFTEIVPGGSITRRVLSRVGDPVGAYGRTLVDRIVPRAQTPVLDEVVRRCEAIFLDNLPVTQSERFSGATALSAHMEQARVVRSAWCPIFSGGEVTHLLAATGPDLTEHDFVAIQLFAAQVGASIKMSGLHRELIERERLAAVGEMAAMLAHEVRNPLTIILNALSTMEKVSPQLALTASSRELFQIVREEASRLQRLVNDLLDFSQPSTVDLKPVNVRSTVDDVISAASHESAFAAASPTWVRDIPGDLQVFTDRAVLRRALLNLVVNALQHMKRNGRLTIAAEREGERVHLRVANEGPVIPPEVAGRVFEPFFTTKAGGTGLGLAIVRRICAAVGAEVSLSQGPGGPVFELSLPVPGAFGEG
jgi:signal transduction histidine kinase